MGKGKRFEVLAIAFPVFALPPVAVYLLPAWFNEGYKYWITNFCVTVVVPLICLLILYKKGVRPHDYGLRRSLEGYKAVEFVAICVLSTLAFLSYIVVANIVQYFLGNSTSNFTDYRLSRDSVGIVAVTYYAITSGFFEEIFYRGILGVVFLAGQNENRAVKETYAIAYVCASALIFTIAHSVSSIASFIYIFYLGLIAAIFYVILRNVWPLVVAHSLTDTVVFVWSSLE